jgi:hypothetical protein
MSTGTGIGRNRRLTAAAAMLAVFAVGFAAMPQCAQARGGVSTGEAVGIGLGSFALGTALGAASNNPYYAPAYPPAYYSPPPPAYYGPNPYAPPRSCWDSYYRRYYAC